MRAFLVAGLAVGLVVVGAGTALAQTQPFASQHLPRPDAVVALDGSGDFTTIQAAVDAVPAGNAAPFTIMVRPGVYHGQVIVPADKPFITLRGVGRDPTDVVISDDRANGTLKPDGT